MEDKVQFFVWKCIYFQLMHLKIAPELNDSSSTSEYVSRSEYRKGIVLSFYIAFQNARNLFI